MIQTNEMIFSYFAIVLIFISLNDRSQRSGSQAIPKSNRFAAQPYSGTGQRRPHSAIHETHEESGDTLQEVCVRHIVIISLLK